MQRQFHAGWGEAVDDDGTIYVSWVDDRNGTTDLWITTSSDDGETWTPGVRADGPEELYSAGWSYPRLTLGTNSIAWIGTQAGPKVVARVALKSELVFGSPITPEGITELGHGALTEDDELWLTWLRYSAGDVVDIVVGNPQLGYTDGVAKINEGLGNSTTCECCPIDLQFRADKTPVIAWRDNLDNIRNMGFASGAPNYGMPAAPVYASTPDWPTFTCPTQGPRLLEMADQSLRMVWSDSSSGSGLVYISRSMDEGQSWSPEVSVDNSGQLAISPTTVRSSNDETIYVAVKRSISNAGAYALVISEDGGSSFAPAVDLIPSEAAGQLSFVEFDRGNGKVAMVGVGTGDKRVHFAWLE